MAPLPPLPTIHPWQICLRHHVRVDVPRAGPRDDRTKRSDAACADGTTREVRDRFTTAVDSGSHILLTTIEPSSEWTESHSPHHVTDPDIRISFRLHNNSHDPSSNDSNEGTIDRFLSVKPYTCTPPSQSSLPPTLSSPLGFSTSVATDLKIIHVDDSFVIPTIRTGI